MDKTAIKNFAVAARIMLIQAVTQMAFEYDVTENGKNDPAQESVNGRSLTQEEKNQRSQLIARININGFLQTMEEAAYTWFNRFIALRFMEVNNYLPSHTRIFSDGNGDFKPEVLSAAIDLDIPGLDKELILELFENQENERLYKYIIITQCNALNTGLPEMFEEIGGWTELLFPKNLLREDSVIAKMVQEIPEDDWKDQVHSFLHRTGSCGTWWKIPSVGFGQRGTACRKMPTGNITLMRHSRRKLSKKSLRKSEIIIKI